jgi:F0F1-type ATP synthase assembly protein I
MEQKDKKVSKATYQLFIIMAMSTAILLVSPVAILIAVGYFADKIFHTTPLYILIGGAIGFVSGIMNVFRMTKMIQKKRLNAKKEK